MMFDYKKVAITGLLVCFSLFGAWEAKAENPNEESYIQDAYEAAARGAEVVFAYEPGNTYRIYCRDTFLTDLKFQAGEEILYVGGGDTARWLIDKAPVGKGLQKEWHLYLKPLKKGIETNIIVTTNRRSYQIDAFAAGFYNPMVAWTYPADDKAALYRRADAEKQALEDRILTLNTDTLNFHYKINRKHYKWSPDAVFDDGVRTYLKMKPDMENDEAPALFLLDKKGKPVLVNYRVIRNYYIVDRVFNKAELSLGTDKVKIEKY